MAKVQKSDAEWRAALTPMQYHVLREEGGLRYCMNSAAVSFEPKDE